jgi:hypothetical protein
MEYFFIAAGLAFLWIGLILVNALVANEKGIPSFFPVLVSFIAAPLVYLYLLATPKRG